MMVIALTYDDGSGLAVGGYVRRHCDGGGILVALS
jgi:hypothetical protein